MDDLNIDKALTLILEKINHWASDLISMLPNLLIASLILVLGFYFSKKIRKFAEKKLPGILPTRTLANLSISLIYIFCLGTVIFVALKILNLDSTITTALAGAGIVSLALAFAFQDIAANFISGIFIAFSRPFYVDELIRVKDFEGFVVEMRLRETIIRTHQGHLISLPNKEVFQNAIINYTRYGKRRADVVGGVSYGEDLRKVREVALKALENVPNVIAEDTTVLFEEFDGSSINFKIRIWVNSNKFGDYLQFINDTIIVMKEAFDENKISMPFPITTLDFGIKGGEKLSDILNSGNQKSEDSK